MVITSKEPLVNRGADFKRWKIEIGYLHIENFTGKTKTTIEQDFYAQIYTFNVLQDIKKTANIETKNKNENKELKYEYKVNINILAGWLKNILIAIILSKLIKRERNCMT